MRGSGFGALLEEYGSHHRARGNLVCHALGITLIVFGMLAVLRAVPIFGPWTAAEVLVAAAGAFYVWRDPVLGLATTGAAALLDVAARAVDWRIGAAAFALGWIFQAIGHAVYEKSSPAFFRNLVHLLVGPAFLVNEVLRIRPRLGTRS